MTLQTNRTQQFFAQIHAGMTVHDLTGEYVGEVDRVHFGDEDLSTPQAESRSADVPASRETFLDWVASAFGENIDLPEEMLERMYREGFIRIKTGLLVPDKVALASQIRSISNEIVNLTLGRNELLTI